MKQNYLPEPSSNTSHGPAGTTENNPAIHRWGTGVSHSESPVGTTEPTDARFFQPSLRDLIVMAMAVPAIHRWAILTSPLTGRQPHLLYSRLPLRKRADAL